MISSEVLPIHPHLLLYLLAFKTTTLWCFWYWLFHASVAVSQYLILPCFAQCNILPFLTITIRFLPKPSRKIGTTKCHLLELSWPMQRLWPKLYFLGIKLFCFSRQKVKTFSICLKTIFVKPHKISTHSAHSDNFYFHLFYPFV